METLEDLERFVQAKIEEHEEAQHDVPAYKPEYDYYEGLLDAYTMVNLKIKEILSK